MSFGDLWDNSKSSNIHVFGVPERLEKRLGAENIEEIMAEHFPNLVKRHKFIDLSSSANLKRRTNSKKT